MVGTWGFTEATNTVVVTDGTSGTPATFADFVTADRAGSAELLAATNCAKDMTLTYQVRPCELRALLISFVIASKSADTDYIWVTGTDAWGTALSEAIDISAGNGTYVSTRRFATITDIDVEDVGDGSGTAAADGTLQVTQPQWGVIWDYGNGCQYQVDASLVIGNGSTSTYFTSLNEMVYISDGVGFGAVTANATLSMGEEHNTWGRKGSFLSMKDGGGHVYLVNGGNLNVYASHIHSRSGNYTYITGNNVVVNKSILTHEYDTVGSNATYLWFTITTLTINGLYLANTKGLWMYDSPDTCDDMHLHDCASGVYANLSGATITMQNARITDFSTSDWQAGHDNQIINTIDPKAPVTTPQINKVTGVINERYTINVHVVDKDGAVLQTVAVLCEDDADADIFDVTTDASGDIAEQTITTRSWSGTAETLDNNNPFKFTLSKAGYETLILENVTVDTPIVWHLELQSQKQPVAPWQEGMM